MKLKTVIKPLCLSLLLVGIFLASGSTASAQVLTSKLKGKVIDGKEGAAQATVKILEDGKIVKGILTKTDGTFEILNMDAGTFSVEVWYGGEMRMEMANVRVVGGRNKTLDLNITESTLTGVVIQETKNPAMDIDNVISMSVVDHHQISDMAVRTPTEIALTQPGVTGDPRTGLSVRGARTSSTAYYQDGVKVIGVFGMPQAAMENVTIITGGIPAEYGDLTGGVISVTTRNPGMRPIPGMSPRQFRKKRKELKEKEEKESPEGMYFEADEVFLAGL